MDSMDIMTGTYTLNGVEKTFNYVTDISIVKKQSFVKFVTDIVVDGIDYMSVLRDMIFNYAVIKMFTNFDSSDENEADDRIAYIEEIVYKTNIASTVKDNMVDGLLTELNNAVDDNISYHTGLHKNKLLDSLVGLINIIEYKTKSIDVKELMNATKVLSDNVDKIDADSIVNAYIKSKEIDNSNSKEDFRVIHADVNHAGMDNDIEKNENENKDDNKETVE